MNPSAYRHIFFDMDGTVTRSRTPASAEMKDALLALIASGRHVIVISGQDTMATQVGAGSYYMGQNGNHTVNAQSGEELWNDVLSNEAKADIYAHIASLPRIPEVRDGADLIEDRGSQVSFSLLGHHADISVKEKFDPGGARRKKMLEERPFISEYAEVKVAGTTTLDYFKKGAHKGSNIERLIERMGWKKEECVYVGDQLYKGGNDEPVIGVIDTHEVKNPDETLAYIESILRGA
jgi:HAD superfamily hydrolase (TIGR01484 family)